MMTRKDFQKIAEALYRSKPLADELDRNECERREAAQWKWDVECVISALATTNPRFDRDKFMSVCLGEE